jgi:inhibitor of KinA
MSYEAIRIFPLGDAALTVEFSTGISVEINKKAISLAGYFEQNPFPGFIEAVPAYSSTTLFYDPATVRKDHPQFPTAFAAVKNLAVEAINGPEIAAIKNSRTVEIPVHFDAESALDLKFVAESNRLSPEKVIEIFTAATYRVFMLGFLPGFSYMGEVDDRIATERKESPRVRIPRGSVGIAGKQTGVYSLESPGGWQIIGRTDTEMFTPKAASPSLLQPGDQVRFVKIK